MKTLICCSLFILATLACLPTADAFSRRSKGSEVAPSQVVTTPVQTSSLDTRDVSPNAVPEPPVHVLMTIGVGVFALAFGIKRLRNQS